MKETQSISFRMVAYTDAAGKYSPEAYRSGNEDNFYVNYDLTDESATGVSQDEVTELGKLGLLMVVADGMGGMNAGEVASQIAVDTVRDAFSPECLSEFGTSTPETRQKYLEKVIRKADRAIKSESRKDKAKAGMGSTVIIGWLFGNDLSLSWCGDSRAYVYNQASGIRLVSHDHSYVQELADNGLLTYEQTFDHPQNNIVTRSLGDPSKEACPESRTVKVGKGDVILLCSDGLSGVLRDRKTFDGHGNPYPEENMEDILKANTSSMKECRVQLWEAAERGDWYDNVTAILCQITDGPESPWGKATPVEKIAANGTFQNTFQCRKSWIAIGATLVAVAICCAFFIGYGGKEIEEPSKSIPGVNTGSSLPNAGPVNPSSPLVEQPDPSMAASGTEGKAESEKGRPNLLKEERTPKAAWGLENESEGKRNESEGKRKESEGKRKESEGKRKEGKPIPFDPPANPGGAGTELTPIESNPD